MAWTAPLTAVANTALTAAQWNASVRDNLLETAPGLASGSGSYFVTAGSNEVAERAPDSSGVLTFETTTSTTYADLATAGPSVTVDCESSALALWAAQGEQADGTSNNSVRVSVQVSGETSVDPDDAYALTIRGTTDSFNRQSVHQHFTGLTPGSHTFTMKYRATGGEANFGRRRLTVIPF